MTDSNELLERGLTLHKSGDLRAAGECYRDVLEAAPDHVGALYLLGMLAFQSGHSSHAIDILNRAVALAPRHAEAFNVLGLAFARLDRNDEAQSSFRRSLSLSPSAETYNSLGIVLKKRGRLREAAVEFNRALDQDPNYLDARYNLGNCYRAEGDFKSARQCFERVITNSPEHGHAHAALGQVLFASREFPAAVEALRQSLLLLGADAELHCDLGDALLETKDTAGSLAEYGKALEQNPTLARAWFSIGCVNNGAKDYATAAGCFRKALETQQSWAEAHHNLGHCLFELGQVDDALIEFDLASAGSSSAMPKMMKAVVIPGSPKANNQTILDVRRVWATEAFPALPRDADVRSRKHTRLRIGYVSAFFGRDNWMKPVWSLLNHHDREQFDIHLFSDGPASAIKHGYEPHPADQFHDISQLGTQGAAQLIRESEIDLLIDLNGYSRVARLPLFACRPAPVILGWFNMFATTGMAAYDYLIGDAEVVPLAEEPFYTERILRVDGSYLTFQVRYPVPPVETRPASTAANFTFGCLAPQYKVTPEVISSWANILKRVPGSVLLLKNTAFRSASAIRFAKTAFAGHGIDPEKLVLEGPADHYEFLQTYGRIDLALDTFPYNGGTTTTEAIWQGVPVVAFYGDRWVSRTSASILRNGDLGEFVANNLDEYLNLAIRWASKRDDLAVLRQTMRARIQRSPVCDAENFARNMERLYLEAFCSAKS